MWNKTPLLLTAATAATTALAGPNCPPLGPVYEKPINFNTSAAIQTAIANLTTTLSYWDQTNTSSIRANTTSYSIEVFSTSKDHPLIFSWHHTAASLAAAPANASGVRRAGPDAVYRLGSLTKIFTMYTWLAQDGDARWNEPITKYVPELAAAAAKAKADPVANVDWDEVTIGALAGQLSGAIRDCKFAAVQVGLRVRLTGDRRFDGRNDAGIQPERGRRHGIPAAEHFRSDASGLRTVAAVQQDS